MLSFKWKNTTEKRKNPSFKGESQRIFKTSFKIIGFN